MVIKTDWLFLLKIFFVVNFFVLISCEETYVPKPKAFLRLNYPKANYFEPNLELPLSFETNLLATKITTKELKSTTKSYGINIEYATMKGTIFLTYKAIENNKENLINFLRDAQNFTQKHTIKADEIPVTLYENKQQQVYGAFAEVKGNVASQAQFYVTDSTHHFLTGSLYFYAKPNYDSILPAANYLQKDIKHIMETLQWK